MNMDKTEKAAAKVGGRFRLSILIQKRLKELGRAGVLKSSKTDSGLMMDKILDEILEDKIQLEEIDKKEK